MTVERPRIAARARPAPTLRKRQLDAASLPTSLSDKADLERYLNMLETTSALVTRKLYQGASVDQVIEQGLGDEWSSWGQGFIKEALWIQFIAQSQ